jgi:hypothetical protein
MASPKQSLLFALPGARAVDWAEAVEKSRVSRCPAPAAPGDGRTPHSESWLTALAAHSIPAIFNP